MKLTAFDIDPIHTAEWRNRAACAEMPTEIFYPSNFGMHIHRPAIRICRRCPVRTQCLLYCLKTQDPNTDYGVFGGTSRAERKEFLSDLTAEDRKRITTEQAEQIIETIDREREGRRTKLGGMFADAA